MRRLIAFIRATHGVCCCRLVLMLLIIGLVCAPEASAQNTPFGVRGLPSTVEAAPQRGWTDALAARVQAIQQRLHRQLGGSVEKLKTEHAALGLLTLIALSFGYGVVHAAGPGHGKAVISSYVLANHETVRRGVALSFIAALAQALMAVALVGALAMILNATGAQMSDWTRWLEAASYALVALLGLYLLARQLSAAFRRMQWSASSVTAAETHAPRRHRDEHDRHCCGHAHAPHPDAIKQPVTLQNMAAVVAAVGIRPCTGAVLVLVFALAQGLFWAGVAATFAMAFGTAVTISILAALAVGSRDLALKVAGGGSVWGSAIWMLCSLGGATAIFLLGAALFIASLGPARPF